MRINYHFRILFFAGLLVSCGSSYCDARYKCVPTSGEFEEGVKFVRVQGEYYCNSKSAEAKNDAKAAAEKVALSRVIGGKIQSGVKIENFLLKEQFINIKGEGYALQYDVVDHDFDKKNKLVYVCVEAKMRSVAVDTIKEFSKHPPKVVVTAVTEDIPQDKRISFMSGVYEKLEDKYSDSIRLTGRYGAVGAYTKYWKAVADNPDADFLIILYGLKYSRRMGNLKGMELNVENITCHTPELGAAQERPIVIPGQYEKMDMRDEDTLQNKIMKTMQDWSLSKIDYILTRAMKRSSKVVTFARKPAYEQFRNLKQVLEKVVVNNADKAEGETALTAIKDKNYFRVRWLGTTDELGDAITDAGEGKFEVVSAGFWKVVVRPVSSAGGNAAVGPAGRPKRKKKGSAAVVTED